MLQRLLLFCALLIVPLLFIPNCTADEEGRLLVEDPGVVSFSFRHQFEDDVEGTLDLIKEMGFSHIEFSGLFGKTAEEMRALIDERNLRCTSYGTGYDVLVEDPDEVIRIATTLGAGHVRVAWIPHEEPFDIDDARRAVTDFNEAGKILKEAGLRFSYHNHGYEFRPYGDGTLFDYIVEHTDPGYVNFQMDVFWVLHPGHDPVELMNRYPDRFVMLHLKDLKKGIEGDYTGLAPREYDVPLGTGQADFPALLLAAQDSAVEYYYIEDATPDVVESVPQSLEYLKSLRKPVK